MSSCQSTTLKYNEFFKANPFTHKCLQRQAAWLAAWFYKHLRQWDWKYLNAEIKWLCGPYFSPFSVKLANHLPGFLQINCKWIGAYKLLTPHSIHFLLKASFTQSYTHWNTNLPTTRWLMLPPELQLDNLIDSLSITRNIRGHVLEWWHHRGV